MEPSNWETSGKSSPDEEQTRVRTEERGKVTQRTKTKLHGPSPGSRHMPEVTKERNERGFEEKHQSDLFPPELPHDFYTEWFETKSH